LNSCIRERVSASIAGYMTTENNFFLSETHIKTYLVPTKFPSYEQEINDPKEDTNLYSASITSLTPVAFARVHILTRSL